jgi:pilus assembly protein CpaB
MRTSTNLTILFLALVMGGIAAFLARDWLAAHTVSNASPISATVVVAAAPLGFGAQITPDNVTEVSWSSNTLPDGAFATVHDLIKDGHRVVLTPLVRNEPVVRSKVTEPGQRGSLSTLIEDGKRAVTVAVDDVRGVAGFIFPGDFVDVVLTRTNNDNGPQNFSEVILQHVKVLAVDQLAGERQQHPTIAKAVTVELTSEQSLKVLLATNIGKLSLILRQAGEETSGPSQRVTEKDLMPAESGAEPVRLAETPAALQPVAATAQPQPNTANVTIVRGTKREEYAVLRGER